MKAARWRAAATAVLLAALLAGCAIPPHTAAPADRALGPWTGRLAVQVADQPQESFSAAFELKGDARAGELSLYSPLGGTVGILHWQPGEAVLRTGSRTQAYGSLEDLMAQVAGTAVPVAALFDWLRGRTTQVPGWQADLSQLDQGRIVAKRYDPLPEANLRLILER